MNLKSKSFDKQIYYRLIALWVICEAILGGIMHSFQIPFAGIVVSGSAVICISLIGYYVPVKGSILRATIIVAIFKMILSPQSPATAYIAVFFQGLTGQLFFLTLRYYRLSCILFGMIALMESALQRVIVLVILYGNNFVKALNIFVSKLTNDSAITNYSFLLAAGYVIVHAIAGLIIGSFAGSIVWQSQFWGLIHEEYIFPDEEEVANKKTGIRAVSKKKMKKGLFVVWLILICFFIQSVFKIGPAILPSNIALQILLRSVMVALTWYLLIGPVLLFFMKKWLSRQKLKSQNDINEVMMMLPSARSIVTRSWVLSGKRKGFKRVTECCKIIMVNTLHVKETWKERV